MKTEEISKVEGYLSTKDIQNIINETRGYDCVLPDFNLVIKSTYRVGNTTRIIDNIIQLLFEGKQVLIIDYPHPNLCNRKINKRLLELIKRRLYMEHNIKDKDLKINDSILTIQLIKY